MCIHVNIHLSIPLRKKIPRFSSTFFFWEAPNAVSRSILRVDGAVGQKAAQPKKKAGEKFQVEKGHRQSGGGFFFSRFLSFFF